MRSKDEFVQGKQSKSAFRTGGKNGTGCINNEAEGKGGIGTRSIQVFPKQKTES